MPDHTIALPSKPKAITEEGNLGVFEIEGLYPGYGHTLGNSLRRIILSSLPGAAITTVKIDGVLHEFSAIEGVKEDVISLILNLKRVRFQAFSGDPVTLTLKVKGPKLVTAADIDTHGLAQVLTPDQPICEITAKIELNVTLTLETGLGYVPKEVREKEKVEIGTISLDAAFTPVRRVNYEVEMMRVGDRTDYNRLKIAVETDGTLTPREAVERAIETMIIQLKAIVGWKEEEIIPEPMIDAPKTEDAVSMPEDAQTADATEFLKTRIDTLNISSRTQNALAGANIRTIGGLVRKTEGDLLDIDGLGEKGIQEIKRALSNFGVTLKQGA